MMVFDEFWSKLVTKSHPLNFHPTDEIKSFNYKKIIL